MEQGPQAIDSSRESYTVFLDDETIMGHIIDGDILAEALESIKLTPGLLPDEVARLSSLAKDRALFNSYMSSDSSDWDNEITTYLEERGFRVGSCGWSLSPDIMRSRPGDPLV
jgi:hypothetical protein